MLTDLAVRPISEAIYRLAVERRSGDLHVSSGIAARMVFFDHGRIVFAGSNQKDERLGEVLVALGRITDDDFHRASGLMQSDRTLRFGDALVEAGVMDKKAVGTSVANHVAKIVLSLFKLDDGTATFDERPCAIPLDYMVSLPLHRLLLSGINTMTNPALVRAGIGDLDRRVRLARVPPFTFTVDTCSATQKDVLEGAIAPIAIRRLAATAQGVTLGRLRAIYAFLASGILEDVASETITPRLEIQSEARGFLLSPQQREPTLPPVVEVVPAVPEPVAPPAAPPRPAAEEPSSLDKERLLTQANASLMVSDFAGAVQAYAKIVEIEPDVAAHRARLAVLMTRWPQTLRQAERQFAEAVRLDPDNPEVHYQFGLYYRTIKVPSRAIAEFRTVVRLDPRHKKARAELDAVSPNDAVFTKLKKLLQ